MSNIAAKGSAAPTPEWDRLELVIRRLLDEHETWRRRARAAEARVGELENALQRVSSGDLDPIALAERAHRYERDNRTLDQRLAQAREVVHRIQTRLQFLEEEH